VEVRKRGVFLFALFTYYRNWNIDTKPAYLPLDCLGRRRDLW